MRHLLRLSVRADTCGITTDRRPICWGVDLPRYASSGTLVTEPNPYTLDVGLPELRDIAVGRAHVCGLSVDDEVWCVGANELGQLGDGTHESRSVAVRVALD